MMFSSLSYNNFTGWANGFDTLTNSDASLLYQISTDFIEHPVSIFDWNFGTCFYIFPNLLVMLAAACLFSNPALAIFISSIIMFSLLIFLMNFLFVRVFKGISYYSLIISNFSILACVVYTIYSGDFYYLTAHLFLPMHSGAFINSIAALVLVFRFFKTNAIKYVVLLNVLNILALISDMIYLIYFIVPLFFTLLSIALLYKNARTRLYLIIILSLFIAGILGLVLNQLIIRFNFLNIYPVTRMPDNMMNSFIVLVKSLFEIFSFNFITVAIAVMSVFSFVITSFIAGKLLFKGKAEFKENELNILIWFLFTLYLLIIVFAASVINGTFLGKDCIRYVITPVYLTLFNTGLLFYYFSKSGKKARDYLMIISFALFFIYILFFIGNYSKCNPFNSISKVQSYYPPVVKAADELSRKCNIKYGLGGYWDARFITVFSREKVIVNFLGLEFRPQKYANNPHSYIYPDYKSGEKIKYNFIVLNHIGDTSMVYNVFDRKLIKKIRIEGFEFYLLPDFYLKPDFWTFELSPQNN
jgi:hypothetical protein